MIRLWLCSSSGGGSEEDGRHYDLVINLASKMSSLLLTLEDGTTSRTNRVGLTSITTNEAMGGHSASLSLSIASPYGDRFRRCVLSQDMLLVEALQPDGNWDVLFDGFVSDVQWNREGSPQNYTYRFTISCEGGHRLINSGWENWQGLLRATDSVRGYVGAQLIKEWSVDTGTMDPALMIRRMLQDGIGRLMNIEARYRTITSDWMQTATGSDWMSDPVFNFNIWQAKDWLIRQQGTLAGIINGLVEPELHEFFLTYRALSDGPIRPTWVFRPKPFPGPAGDDDRWNTLVPQAIKVNCCGGASGSRNDDRMANVFQWSGLTTNLSNSLQFAGKLFIGAQVHEPHVQKYGYRSRQIQTSLVGISKDNTGWIKTIPKKIVERIAWQDSPLPWLEMQSRHYPWLPLRVKGLHIGNIVHDSTDGHITGYLVSVQHQIRVTNNAFDAFTVLGLDRVCDGATPETYAESVRKFANGLEYVEYAPTTTGRTGEIVDSGKADPVGTLPKNSSTSNKVSCLPVSGTVTSEYHSTSRPKHGGIDIAAAKGTTIKSPVNGTVKYAGNSGPNGNYVRISDPSNGFVHTLCHLSSITVKTGDKVDAGQTIGIIGHTGRVIASANGDGTHLHWQVRNGDGLLVNPRLMFPT